MFNDRQGNRDPLTVIVFGLGTLAAIAIVGMIGGAWVSMILQPAHVFDAQGVGLGIGGVLTGLATFTGAYAVYWRFDGVNAKAMAEAER